MGDAKCSNTSMQMVHNPSLHAQPALATEAWEVTGSYSWESSGLFPEPPAMPGLVWNYGMGEEWLTQGPGEALAGGRGTQTTLVGVFNAGGC